MLREIGLSILRSEMKILEMEEYEVVTHKSSKSWGRRNYVAG